MMIATFSGIPGNIAIFCTVIFVIAASVVFYALYKKGDVRAVFSHGKTIFRLEAKERNPQK
jgi:hypothetical protein